MNVLVLGSGVIGTTSAWYLAQQGFTVTVLDRERGPALETSFANAGQVSPGYASPWAAPGIPLKALAWLCQRHAPLRIRPDYSLAQIRWLLQMLSQCNAPSYARNKGRMVRLAEYSRDCLRTLRADLGLEYEQRSGGTLQLFRTQAQLDAAGKDIEVLRAQGVAWQLLDAAGCVAVEPGLDARGAPLAGGLRLPNDETGDCQLFTTRLAERAQRAGVRFLFGRHIEALEVQGGRVTGVRVDGTHILAEHYVVALGSYSPALLAPLGLRLPVYPVKGYSITVPIAQAQHAPQSTLLDERYKVALTRFDQRIRVGGMAELSGFDLALRPQRRQTLEKVLHDWFPEAGRASSTPDTPPYFWTGLRPMTPDGTPVIGPTSYPNLWLNTGHGTLGWTMACGSAALLADLLAQRQPAIRADDLALARYHAETAPRARRPHTPAETLTAKIERETVGKNEG